MAERKKILKKLTPVIKTHKIIFDPTPERKANMSHTETIYRFLDQFCASFKGINREEKNVHALIDLRAEIIEKHKQWLESDEFRLKEKSSDGNLEVVLGGKVVEWVCDSKLRPYHPGWDDQEEASANGSLMLSAVLNAFGLEEPELGQIVKDFFIHIEAHVKKNWKA